MTWLRFEWGWVQSKNINIGIICGVDNVTSEVDQFRIQYLEEFQEKTSSHNILSLFLKIRYSTKRFGQDE